MTVAPAREPPARAAVAHVRRAIRRVLHRTTPGEDALRRRLARQGASMSPTRPDNIWGPWVNAPLRTRADADAAVATVSACGLPAHQDGPKNWDLLIALGTVLERTTKSARVLEMGAPKYAQLLPWLYLYGYRHLDGIDLVYDRPVDLGPIHYQRMDLTATTFRDASFEAIACLSVVEHGVHLEAYLREAARLLRPGGVLITSTDFWCEPVDTHGQEAYGGPIRIFGPADIEACLAIGARLGLAPAGPIAYECDERVVRWERFGLEYTFIAFVLTKTGA